MELCSEKFDIGAGEIKKLTIRVPIELIEEAKRQGKTKAILKMKYNDDSGKEFGQDFEFDIETGEIREINKKEE